MVSSVAATATRRRGPAPATLLAFWACLLGAGAAQAYTYTKVGSGDWTEAIKWRELQVPPPNHGAAILAETGIAKATSILGIQLDAVLSISGDEGSLQVTSGNINIGTTIDASGTLSVNGKAAIPLQVTGDIIVGQANRGVMRVDKGEVWVSKSVLVGSNGGNVPRDHSSFGELTVSGAESILRAGALGVGNTISARHGGEGAVTFSDGAKVFTGKVSIAVGQLTLQDAGTAMSLYRSTMPGIGDGLGVQGRMRIQNGATVDFSYPSGSVYVSKKGNLLVDGSGSRLSTFYVSVSDADLTISRGAHVHSDSGMLTAGARVDLSGAGTLWRVDGKLQLDSYTAPSFMSIADGAQVLANELIVGDNNGPSRLASLTVTGNTSGLVLVSRMDVGKSGRAGRMEVLGGALVTSPTAAIAGTGLGSQGEVHVDGPGSAWRMSGALSVGAMGEGMVTVANGGTLAARSVSLGTTVPELVRNGAKGLINVGAAVGSAAAAPGGLDIDDGIGIGRTGTIVFNHTGNAYSFATGVTSVGAVGAGLIEHHAGRTRFDVDLTQFTGETHVIGGTLAVNQALGSKLVTVASGATLGGSGNILGDVVAQPGATVQPGNSPGVLTVGGNFALQAGATLTMEIAGTAAGTQFDVLNVGGDVSLAGSTLELVFVGGFAPAAGQQFTLFDVGGAFTGTDTITVLGLLPGWQFSPRFDAAAGSFSLTALNDGVSASPVPAPASAWLLAAGLAALGWRLRQQGKGCWPSIAATTVPIRRLNPASRAAPLPAR